MWLFNWFDANCSWIYDKMNIFHFMFVFNGGEMQVPMMIFKTLVMSIWFMMIIFAPLWIIIRGFGYIIGGWTGYLNSYFVEPDK